MANVYAQKVIKMYEWTNDTLLKSTAQTSSIDILNNGDTMSYCYINSGSTATPSTGSITFKFKKEQILSVIGLKSTITNITAQTLLSSSVITNSTMSITLAANGVDMYTSQWFTDVAGMWNTCDIPVANSIFNSSETLFTVKLRNTVTGMFRIANITLCIDYYYDDTNTLDSIETNVTFNNLTVSNTAIPINDALCSNSGNELLSIGAGNSTTPTTGYLNISANITPLMRRIGVNSSINKLYVRGYISGQNFTGTSNNVNLKVQIDSTAYTYQISANNGNLVDIPFLIEIACPNGTWSASLINSLTYTIILSNGNPNTINFSMRNIEFLVDYLPIVPDGKPDITIKTQYDSKYIYMPGYVRSNMKDKILKVYTTKGVAAIPLVDSSDIYASTARIKTHKGIGVISNTVPQTLIVVNQTASFDISTVCTFEASTFPVPLNTRLKWEVKEGISVLAQSKITIYKNKIRFTSNSTPSTQYTVTCIDEGSGNSAQWIGETLAPVCTAATLNPTSLLFTTFTPKTITVVTVPAKCRETPVFSSSNTAVATVNSSGVVTPVKEYGSCTITVTIGSVVKTCTVQTKIPLIDIDFANYVNGSDRILNKSSAGAQYDLIINGANGGTITNVGGATKFSGGIKATNTAFVFPANNFLVEWFLVTATPNQVETFQNIFESSLDVPSIFYNYNGGFLGAKVNNWEFKVLSTLPKVIQNTANANTFLYGKTIQLFVQNGTASVYANGTKIGGNLSFGTGSANPNSQIIFGHGTSHPENRAIEYSFTISSFAVYNL